MTRDVGGIPESPTPSAVVPHHIDLRADFIMSRLYHLCRFDMSYNLESEVFTSPKRETHGESLGVGSFTAALESWIFDLFRKRRPSTKSVESDCNSFEWNLY